MIARAAQEAAERVASVEAEREHRDQTPEVNGKWNFERRPNNPELRILVYRFTLPRPYKISAIARDGGPTDGRTTASVTAPTKPSGEWTVWAEDWTDDRKVSAYKMLTLQFWPPDHEEGRARPWRCLCGREMASGDPPHWDVDVAIEPPQPPTVRWA